ncbi:RNA-directed DNA polymerase like [Apostasia shenzhenica]|uniref:RNA-directed DNA polymerase like n=1 Tax=Apostasia shenzhenica TaxID=1088818 RepID=A0A2I0A5E1_9ASPA|nr:RNA-directed DNA polymerase like [Apostasia shenzhenica]
MCIDFIDLNKACPKDFYPLPKIERLVDSSAGYTMLSFLDAFSGIRMAEQDEKHTSFITDHVTFCYRVMPFGLKNAGATYIRMINTVFRGQKGHNMETYVDDLLIKSQSGVDHFEDLHETLETYRVHNIRLNPSKSIFDAAYEKFLSHMVSARGIEFNPKKIKAILDLDPPRTVTDIQKLNERIMALSRFNSKMGDRCLPFLKGASGRPHLLGRRMPAGVQFLKGVLAFASAVIRPCSWRRPPPLYQCHRQLRLDSPSPRRSRAATPHPLRQSYLVWRQTQVPRSQKTVI